MKVKNGRQIHGKVPVNLMLTLLWGLDQILLFYSIKGWHCVFHGLPNYVTRARQAKDTLPSSLLTVSQTQRQCKHKQKENKSALKIFSKKPFYLLDAIFITVTRFQILILFKICKIKYTFFDPFHLVHFFKHWLLSITLSTISLISMIFNGWRV